ncbi:LysR family transcriptional regulator [Demequina iriomotensis]|uniref:LysR family transcriptional regulator n=1 Tax=Demequina iriomotensis TaxID=1536641 RepID=UPI00078531D5|nr:LysR family transcriptional regulator [Demequina iriomotensis]
MDVSVPTLRYFCVLAEELHFAHAAARLTITSPSLSQQIAGLERSVGGRLFERTSRSVTLTPLGTALLPRARQVVEAHDELTAWIAERRAPGEATLRLGVVAAGAGPLTAAIMTAVSQIPNLRLEMRRVGFFEVERELVARRVDAVLAPAPLPHDQEVLSTAPLWTEPRVLILRATHPLAGRPSISIDEVRDETFVAVSGDQSEAIAWWTVDPRPDGSHPQLGPRADDIEGLLELVSAGMGVNIAAASAAAHYPRADLAFVPIGDIEPATILLCTRRRREPVVAAFEVIAQAEARRARGEDAHAAEPAPRP